MAGWWWVVVGRVWSMGVRVGGFPIWVRSRGVVLDGWSGLGRWGEEILMHELGHFINQVRDIEVEASPPILLRHEGFHP